MSVTRDWLARIYGQSPGSWTLVVFDKGRPKLTKWVGTDARSLSRAAKAIERYSDKHDIYASVGTWAKPAERGRGNAKDVISIAGLWSDLDIGTEGHKPAKSGLPNPADEEQALSILDGLPEPSAVIHSGGGLQVWHLFDEPFVFPNEPGNMVAAGVAEGWQRRLVANGEAKGFHVDSIGDLARILRVPGGFNHKTSTARPVRLLRPDGAPAATYPAAELSAFGLLGEPATPGVRNVSGDDSGDSFPLTWPQILEPHGWTLTGEHDANNDPFWVRPGKDKRDGHSAVTHPDVMVNWSGTAGLPSKSMNKLQMYAHLNHAGDLKAARQALGLVKAPARLGMVLSRSGLKTLPPAEPLIEEVISDRSAVIMVGPSRIGKTFTALSLAASVATGKNWLGQRVIRTRPVLYVVGEGASGLDKRIDAWEARYNGGRQVPDEMMSFLIRPASLLEAETWQAIKEKAQQLGAGFVAMDTMSSLAPDADETADAPKIIRHLIDLAGDLDATALLLHHPGWGDQKRVRGGSALEANVDEVLLLSWETDDEAPEFVMRRKKVKNGEGGRTYMLTRRNVGDSQVIDKADGEVIEVEGTEEWDGIRETATDT